MYSFLSSHRCFNCLLTISIHQMIYYCYCCFNKNLGLPSLAIREVFSIPGRRRGVGSLGQVHGCLSLWGRVTSRLVTVAWPGKRVGRREGNTEGEHSASGVRDSRENLSHSVRTVTCFGKSSFVAFISRNYREPREAFQRCGLAYSVKEKKPFVPQFQLMRVSSYNELL